MVMTDLAEAFVKAAHEWALARACTVERKRMLEQAGADLEAAQMFEKHCRAQMDTAERNMTDGSDIP